MLVQVPNPHVVLPIDNGNIRFEMQYIPDVEFFFVKDLNDPNLIGLDPMMQILAYTGTTNIRGILSLKTTEDQFTKYVALHERLTPDVDSRFAYLKGFDTDSVEISEYDPFAKFDPSTRLIEYERKLFDRIIAVFRYGLLNQVKEQSSFLDGLTSHTQIEWV